jgi:hypothetical protein
MPQAPIRKIRGWRYRRKRISRVLIWPALFLLAAAAFLIVRQFAISGSSPNHSSPAAAIHSSSQPLDAFASEPEPEASAAASESLYSVIPGGVHSEKQLAEALAHDPAVARHYANFDLRKLRFIRLRKGREAYVSFRLGNLIFWTNHKIPLFSGETLLTDGTHYARSRCGNRVSYIPKQPTSPLEPSDQALAAPILHLSPSSYQMPPLSEGVHLAPTPLSGGSPVGSSGGSPIFPVFLLPPGGGGGSGSGTPVDGQPGGGPVSVPEPGTIILLSCGVVVLGLKSLWSSWRN